MEGVSMGVLTLSRWARLSPRARLVIAAALGLVLAGGAAAASGWPGPVPPRPGRVASLAPGGAAGSLTPGQVLRAARTCAARAANAGWADNGLYGGNLVTAVAVCIAESGGHRRIYHCDATGAVGYYPPVSCASGSYDRGLWQLNSRYQASVSDACAFQARCNADAAYQISDRGTSFSPWAVYDSGFYTTYLDDAQAAVSALTSGAVASGEFGVCLARSQPGAGAAVVAGACGRKRAAQRWTLSHGAVGHDGLCLTAASGSGRPPVSLAACDGSAGQAWTPYGLAGLRNGQTGQCLDDPGGTARAGTALALAACTGAREQTWWLP
jgi:hypothetical protein